ncbi:MAG: hypothetical protein KGL19_04455 [Bacteroidota bacterium]|nr:hypothetical protein [Bacteroidota bacterium]
MKKLLILAVSAFLVSGVAFAQDSTKTKMNCGKECAKGKSCGKDCKKKDCKKDCYKKSTATMKS